MSNDSSKTSPRLSPWSAIGVTLLAYFGSQIGAAILIGVGVAASGNNAEKMFDTFIDSTFGQFAFIFLVEILTLAVLYAFVRYRRISWQSLGLGRWPKLGDAGYALLAFAIYFVLAAVIMAIVSAVLPGLDVDQKQQIGFDSAKSGWELGLVFLSLVVLVPITEEIMIRGFLYTGLRQKFTRIIAALIASLIFGAAHLQLGSGAPPLYVAAIDTFLLSIVLIYLRERTGGLWAGILVHALKNGLAFMALFVFAVR